MSDVGKVDSLASPRAHREPKGEVESRRRAYQAKHADAIGRSSCAVPSGRSEMMGAAEVWLPTGYDGILTIQCALHTVD